MNSQDFLIMNVVGAGAFIFWYLAARGGTKGPTQLNLKASDSEPLVTPAESSPAVQAEGAAAIHAQHPDWGAHRTKTLNVMFNYNGHSWDAYEVLGVPAGANLKLVTESYHDAIRRCDKESVEFLETAYRTILSRK
ncbi:hypothetical protein D3C87_161650 [compost metagenome]